MPFGMGVGFGFGGSGAPRSIVTANLLHDWRMDEDAAITDYVSGLNMTTLQLGQALDFSGNPTDTNWLWDTGALDYQMAFVNGKTSASIGAVFNPDTPAGDYNGHLYGGWYGATGTGLPLAVTWRRVSSVNYIYLGFWKTPLTWTQCYYRVAGGNNGVWKRVWWQLDSSQTTHLGTSAGIPARVRCWLDGVEVDVSWVSGGTWDEGSQLASHNTLVRNRLSFGARSSDGSGGSLVDFFNGKIQRGFVTSQLVTQAQAETLLKGHPYQFPTLGDGHLHVLDYGAGTVATCYRDGTTLTAYHAAGLPIDTAWANARRQEPPCPQTALRGHGVGKKAAAHGTSRVVTTLGAYGPSTGTALPVPDVTVCAWVKADAPYPVAATVARAWQFRSAASGNIGLAIMISAAGTIYWYADNGTPYTTADVTAANHGNKWTFVTFSTDGTDVLNCKYATADGSALLSMLGSAGWPGKGNIFTTDQVVRFLAHSTDSSEGVSIGRVMLYDRVLTDEELLKNFKATRNQYV